MHVKTLFFASVSTTQPQTVLRPLEFVSKLVLKDGDLVAPVHFIGFRWSGSRSWSKEVAHFFGLFAKAPAPWLHPLWKGLLFAFVARVNDTQKKAVATSDAIKRALRGMVERNVLFIFLLLLLSLWVGVSRDRRPKAKTVDDVMTGDVEIDQWTN